MKNISLKHVFCVICITVMMFFMATIILRMSAARFVVSGKENAITDFMPEDIKEDILSEIADSEKEEISVWQQRYPFSDNDSMKTEKKVSVSEKLKSAVLSEEENIEKYTSDYLFQYRFLTETAKSYEEMMQWNITPYSEYNRVIELEDGYFTGIEPKVNVRESAEAVISFKDYCEEKGIHFLYMQMPSKISKYDDPDLSGVTDFTNQNADELVESLRENNTDVLDIRDKIHEAGFTYRDLFYKTDHHWKAETGLWVSGKILEYLDSEYQADIDLSVTDQDRFDYVNYPEWFLGSQGKKVTLSRAKPEDFTLIYPTFETLLHYEIPDLNIDVTGDFSVTYDMSRLDKIDYYGKNPYGAYNHGDRSLIRLTNKLTANQNKILIVHNSYANCVIPFLSLGIGEIDCIDLRHFDGSLKAYIEEMKPDTVILTYPPDRIGQLDYSTHISEFDFR